MGWIRKGLTIHYCLRAESCTGELKFDSFDLDLCARFSDPSDTCINSQNWWSSSWESVRLHPFVRPPCLIFS